MNYVNNNTCDTFIHTYVNNRHYSIDNMVYIQIYVII